MSRFILDPLSPLPGKVAKVAVVYQHVASIHVSKAKQTTSKRTCSKEKAIKEVVMAIQSHGSIMNLLYCDLN